MIKEIRRLGLIVAGLAIILQAGCADTRPALKKPYSSFSAVEIKFTVTENVSADLQPGLKQTIDYVVENLPIELRKKGLFAAETGDKLVINGKITDYRVEPGNAATSTLPTTIVKIEYIYSLSTGETVGKSGASYEMHTPTPENAFPSGKSLVDKLVLSFQFENDMLKNVMPK